MKSFIYTLTSLSLLEFLILVVCFYFYIQQFFFGDYMNELYERNGNPVDNDDDYIDDHKTSKFTDLFNDYHYMSGLGYAFLMFLAILCLFIDFVSMLSFAIVYLCHLCRRTCCKCKKCCSYTSLIFCIIFSIPYIIYAANARSKIDLPDEEIFCFDSDFNEKTRKNINFMKLRRIILITGVSLVYVSYTVRFVLLCLFNKKLIIVDENVTQVAVYVDANNNVNNNNGNIGDDNKINNNNNNNIDNINTLNQVQVLTTTNDDRTNENK